MLQILVYSMIALIAVILLIKNSVARLAIFILGAMLVFQSSDGLNAPKLAYLAAVIFSFVVSAIRLRGKSGAEWLKPYKIAIRGCIILTFFVAIISILSILNDEYITRVSRDALTYLLIAVAPIIGLDAAGDATPRSAHIAIFSFTGLAAIGFSIFWLSARGVSTLGIDRLVLSSMLLAGFGVVFGFTKALVGRIKPLWLTFSIFALGSILITGTRTGLVVIVALVATLGRKQYQRVNPTRAVTGLVVVAMSTYLLLPLIASQVASASFFQARIGALTTTFSQGIDADASGAIRQRAYSYALEIWNQNPLLGIGLGHAFPNPNPNRGDADFQLDTPALYLAKFGILGTVVLIFSLVLIATAISTSSKSPFTPSIEQTAARAMILLWFLILPFGSPTEDKGFALSLCLIFFALGTRNRAQTLEPIKDGGSSRHTVNLIASRE